MDRFYGFDLGDAESAVARLNWEKQGVPDLLPVCGERSFITAYATLPDGSVLVGEKACYASGALRRKLRFKSAFLTPGAGANEDIRRFAVGVLAQLHESGALNRETDGCFYVGCPAGWDRRARERYREIFELAGYPPTRIVSESRAAMVSACQSKHLQVGVDILSKPVLVVDVGSSTTDFAYIMGGREVEMQTAGEVALGGGIMDELLLESCVAASPDAAEIRAVFAESEPWKTYCEFKARRLKERYFSDEAYWRENECAETVLLRYRTPAMLKLRMDEEAARRLLLRPAPRLNGQSFREAFLSSLREVRNHITGDLPELIFLTGGVSRLPAIRDWCEEVFPESVVILGAEPEFSVARGLAWSGKIDEEMRQFRQDLEALQASDTVENIVRAHINDLYRRAIDALVEPLLLEVAQPVFERWRNGELRRLSDTDAALEQAIAAWLRTESAMERLVGPITAWLKPVADELEAYTVPICVAHHVPYTALSLRSGLSASELDIRLGARDMFAVEQLTWLIDSILSVLVGLLCGGSGIAVISSGPAGIVAGIAASLLLLVLGKERMEQALLNADLPLPMRRLTPRDAIHTRLDRISREVKQHFYENLEGDGGADLTAKMVDELSAQIEQCLTKMAEIVEIPLGAASR